MLFCCIFSMFFLSPISVKSATQGIPGTISRGSLRISLIIYPTLTVNIDSNSDTLQGASEQLNIGQKTDFCISGRGIGQYSLSKNETDHSNNHPLSYDLFYQNNADSTRLQITETSLSRLNAASDCELPNSHILLQKRQNNSDEAFGSVELVVHAE